jgi:hypothetical protein
MWSSVHLLAFRLLCRKVRTKGRLDCRPQTASTTSPNSCQRSQTTSVTTPWMRLLPSSCSSPTRRTWMACQAASLHKLLRGCVFVYSSKCTLFLSLLNAHDAKFHNARLQASNATAENGPWLITLDAPTYTSVMSYADNRYARTCFSQMFQIIRYDGLFEFAESL